MTFRLLPTWIIKIGDPHVFWSRASADLFARRRWKFLARFSDKAPNTTIQMAWRRAPLLMDSVTHFEIPCSDRPKMQKFYEAAFGWRIAKLPDMDYHWVTTTETDPDTWMPKSPGAINGGMRKKEAPQDGPVMVLSVKSVDDSVKRVEELGGSVIFPKKKVGGHGFYAQVADIEGNALGLWQAAK